MASAVGVPEGNCPDNIKRAAWLVFVKFIVFTPEMVGIADELSLGFGIVPLARFIPDFLVLFHRRDAPPVVGYGPDSR